MCGSSTTRGCAVKANCERSAPTETAAPSCGATGGVDGLTAAERSALGDAVARARREHMAPDRPEPTGRTLSPRERAVARAAVAHARRYDGTRAPAPVIVVTGNCPYCGDTLYRDAPTCVKHRDLPAVDGAA